MTYSETLKFVFLVVNRPKSTARADLFLRLLNEKYNEAQFCNAVIKHGTSINLSNEQWFDFFKKIPNILFKHERALMNKLTEQQRKEINFD
jgi:hypothetical protein